MTQCPVCGKQLDVKSAKTVAYEGRIYLVASENCKAQFEADPGRYVSGSERSPQSHHAHRHGCC